MCCFSGAVRSVANTNIYARLSKEAQYLVYSMEYAADQPVAMILPLPVGARTDSAVRFISLKDYPHFFTDLRRGFPVPRSSPGRRPTGAPPPAAAAPLPVHEVGDFVASFVPTLADFD